MNELTDEQIDRTRNALDCPAGILCLSVSDTAWLARAIIAQVKPPPASLDVAKDSPEQYIERQRVMAQSKDLAQMQLSTAYEVFSGFVNIDGVRCQVDFQTQLNASQAEKDSAFVAALSQVAKLDYLSIGTT